MSRRALSRSLAIGLAAVSASAVFSVMPAQADTVVASWRTPTSTGTLGNGAAPGGTVTRSQAVARAQDWVNKAVPYSPNGLVSPYGWWADAETGGRYRQDCSGLVSMAWQLTDSLNTNSLVNVSTRIGLDDLQPGDALNNIDTHTALFVGWTDGSHNAANIIEEWSRSGPTRARVMNRSEINSRHFYAYRYNRIADDSAPTVSKTKGQFFHGTRNADGTWTGLGALNGVATAPQFNGTEEAIAAAPDGSSQVVGIGLDGNVYHTVRYTSGSWQPWGALTDFNGKQMAASQVSIAVGPDGSAQVLAVGADTVLYHAIRSANGSWSAFQPLVLKDGSPMKAGRVSIAVGPDGSSQTLAIGGDGVVYHTVRAADGSWTPFQPVLGTDGGPVHASDVSIAANRDGSAQLLVIPGDGNVYHEIRRSDGSWTGFAPIDGVGTPTMAASQASITITPDGTAQVLAIGNDGNVYHRSRNSDGSWTGFAPIAGAYGASTFNAQRVGIAGMPDGSAQILVTGGR
ncbi:hypothetical protein ACFYUY_19455 [Kitasatospora sp. NPDC004745]|uniref:hypothetical protein n=1 Tax=unclassified Kitasatospora TaxID=2633591 RepID=UPI003408F3DE